MGDFWAGLAWGVTFGSMFGALVVGSIWARHFLRTYRDQCKRQDRSDDREIRLLAITETLHKDSIRASADEIDRTQRLIVSRALNA